MERNNFIFQIWNAGNFGEAWIPNWVLGCCSLLPSASLSDILGSWWAERHDQRSAFPTYLRVEEDGMCVCFTSFRSQIQLHSGSSHSRNPWTNSVHKDRFWLWKYEIPVHFHDNWPKFHEYLQGLNKDTRKTTEIYT